MMTINLNINFTLTGSINYKLIPSQKISFDPQKKKPKFTCEKKIKFGDELSVVATQIYPTIVCCIVSGGL